MSLPSLHQTNASNQSGIVWQNTPRGFVFFRRRLVVAIDVVEIITERHVCFAQLRIETKRFLRRRTSLGLEFFPWLKNEEKRRHLNGQLCVGEGKLRIDGDRLLIQTCTFLYLRVRLCAFDHFVRPKIERVGLWIVRRSLIDARLL